MYKKYLIDYQKRFPYFAYIEQKRKIELTEFTQLNEKQLGAWWQRRRDQLEKHGTKFEFDFDLVRNQKYEKDEELADVLEPIFQKNHFASFEKQAMLKISEERNWPYHRIRSWFIARRRRQRRETLMKDLTDHQKLVLTECMKTTPSPSSQVVEKLSSELNLTKVNINDWFQSKRSRKKQTKEKDRKVLTADKLKALENDYAKDTTCFYRRAKSLADKYNLMVKDVQNFFRTQNNMNGIGRPKNLPKNLIFKSKICEIIEID